MEPPGDLHVLAHDGLPIDAWALEDGRKPLQARLTEEGAHPFSPNLSIRYRGVPVAVRAAGVAGVVHVEELELLQADLRVDLVHEVLHPVRRADVVAGRVQVAGVDAETKALRAAGPL